jgi:hypothetical protein
MKNETYNGWTNYATWRVNQGICGGLEEDAFKNMEAEEVKEYAENIIFEYVAWNSLVSLYARAFLSDVNWQEIKDAYNGEETTNNVNKL